MRYILRPEERNGGGVRAGRWAAVAVLASATLMTAQAQGLQTLLNPLHPFMLHAPSQGYLGVLTSDVDNESFTKLRLTERRGAVITLIDHDAPACQSGVLKVNDVVLAMNGQNVENADQFGRMLREIPAGKAVSLVIVRDGDTRTVAVTLVDRRVMEHDLGTRQTRGLGRVAARGRQFSAGR